MIDASTIQLMKDEQLKMYLPSYGDRLAVLGFCRRKENSHINRKSKLFERLETKLTKEKPCDEGGSSENQGEHSPPTQKKKCSEDTGKNRNRTDAL